MKILWVKNLKFFFENIGKSNVRQSSKKNCNSSKMIEIKENGGQKMETAKERTVAEDDGAVAAERRRDAERRDDCGDEEHCLGVRAARDFFEGARLGAVSGRATTEGSVAEAEGPPGTAVRLKKYISVYDIFSGAVIDIDIPPIEDDHDHDGVFYNDDSQLPDQTTPSVIQPADNVDHRDHIDSKKSLVKSPSYAERKSAFKKGSSNFKTIATESDIDKENNGVIIRMKNQETYYDERTKYKSMLPEVPLHQATESKRGRRTLYSQKALYKSIDILESNSGRDANNVNSILFEEVPLPASEINVNNIDKSSQDNDSDSEELEPNEERDSYSEVKLSQLISQGPQRIKWAETEEGMKIIRIKELKSDIIKWQEAQFEVITSEASYYRSLQILVNNIYKSPYMMCQGEKKQFSFNNDSVESNGSLTPTIQPVMTALQKHHLFSNIFEIHICSGELLKALETRWKKNPFIEDLSDILVDFSKEKLKPYITYIRNQHYQTSTYNDLLTKPEFQNAITHIETDIDCGMMNLSSFLLLPMQRLLRLKLLFTVVKHYIPQDYPVQGCDAALASIEGLIKDCSDQKTVMEQKEEIMMIYNRLIFKQQTGVSIGSKPLLKNGRLKVCPSNSKASRSLNASFMNRNNNKAQLYLFEDQLIIAKNRKLPLCLSSNDNREMVVEICPRSEITFEVLNSKPLFSPKNNFKLILRKGIKGSAEYTCEAESKVELEEWQNVFSPDNIDWEDFEFNDVLVTKDYVATNLKELDLKRGQILSIIKRIDDNKAIATSGDKQGEITMSYVQNVCSPQANAELLQEIRESINYKKSN